MHAKWLADVEMEVAPEHLAVALDLTAGLLR